MTVGRCMGYFGMLHAGGRVTFSLTDMLHISPPTSINIYHMSYLYTLIHSVWQDLQES